MNKFYGMIGIGRKGGKVIYGYDQTINLIKDSKAHLKTILVVVANDASDKTKKNVIFECNKYQCEYLEYGEKVVYGKIMNKKEVSVLAVTDQNIISYLNNNI